MAAWKSVQRNFDPNCGEPEFQKAGRVAVADNSVFELVELVEIGRDRSVGVALG